MSKTTVTRKAVTAMAVAGVLFGAAACGSDDDQANVASENASASRAAGAAGAAASEAAESDATAGSTTSTTEEDGGRTVVVDGASTEAEAGEPCEAPATQAVRGDAPPPAESPEPECEPAGPTPEPELGTGDVQVTLRWESSADIDLHVFEPNGTEIWFGDRGPTETGGQLDVDSNVGCEQEASVENVFWPTGQAPEGDYTIEVTGYAVDGCGSGDYVVTATVRGEVVLEESGTVGEDETDTYEIEA